MMRRILAVPALLGLLPAVVAAQDLAALCEKARRPPVGAWSEFKWVGGRTDGATMRMSIVGTERREGAEYLWMEMAMSGFPMGPRPQSAAQPLRMISKLLVPGFGAGQGSPLASIIKVGDAPAMEMPAAQSRMGAQGAPNLVGCRDAKVIGWESVTVPAGTFRAIHIRNANGQDESWVVPDLPFALVKESGNEEGQPRQLVLTGHGRGARSQITEHPRPFDPRLLAEMLTGARTAPPN